MFHNTSVIIGSNTIKKTVPKAGAVSKLLDMKVLKVRRMTENQTD